VFGADSPFVFTAWALAKAAKLEAVVGLALGWRGMEEGKV